MKRILPLLLFLLLLTGCGGNAADGAYRQITQEEAKEMMDNQEVIILDVREQDEYDGGHIPGAVLLPVGTIDEDTAAEVIPEKDSTVLVYCRSGNRSKLTKWLHSIEVGQQVTIRGPYGRNFPVDSDFLGQDMLFIAGGIGIAPLRCVINYCRHYKDRYGKIDVVYGARSVEDIVYYDEITNDWAKDPNVNVYITIDRNQPEWKGHVGFVPNYVKELKFSNNKTVVLCGPPIMIKLTLKSLEELGFDKTQIYTTMELKMKCGIGKCGRCNIGNKYVCKDGPVFRYDELSELPNEY